MTQCCGTCQFGVRFSRDYRDYSGEQWVQCNFPESRMPSYVVLDMRNISRSMSEKAGRNCGVYAERHVD